MIRTIILALSTLALAPGAYAQAFGITKGMPISGVSGAKKISDDGPVHQYNTTKVPAPHSEFDSYTLAATSRQGVCSVTGVGKDHEGDRYGSSIRSVYNELSSALRSKYGTGKEFDFLRRGALWDDPEDFAMSLRANERSLVYFWTRDEGSVLPDDIQAISLTVYGSSSSTTYIKLNYEFSNMDGCLSEQEKRDNSGL